MPTRSPAASSDLIRERMQRQRRRDTGAELALRSELHRRGLRYRLHRRLLPGLRREIDIAFPASRVAVQVHSCFWHGCAQHGTTPKSNSDWWGAKLRANRWRDADTAERLVAAGWTVIEVWEHDDPSASADRIAAQVTEGRRL